VQIKSTKSQAELNDYLGRFRRDGAVQLFSSLATRLKATLSLPRSRICTCGLKTIYRRCRFEAGIFDWLD